MAAFGFVQTTEFTPALDVGSSPWAAFGNIKDWSYDPKEKSFLLQPSKGRAAIKLYILGPSSFRLRFNPNGDIYSGERSSAVVCRQLGDTKIEHRLDSQSNTLQINLDQIRIEISLLPFALAVYRGQQLIHATSDPFNLVYIPAGSAEPSGPEVTACFFQVAPGAGFFGWGERAGINLNNNFHTTTFFNYDNFQYQGSNQPDSQGNLPVIPANSDPGPLNIEEPLYNSIPALVEWNPNPTGKFAGDAYANLILLDNPGQTFFNVQANDYSQYMDGKYYFGALYTELDYYYLAAESIGSVLSQYRILTGPCALPPMYALGYHQGGYGYYNRERLLDVAESYRKNQIPIDGLHIDVDFQNNYRTFTSSQEKFGNAKELFDQLHAMGFKCSTNITGIMTIVPWDEYGCQVPYTVKALDEHGVVVDRHIIQDGLDKNMFILDRYADFPGASSPFITNENYGCNYGFNIYPSPGHVNNVPGCSAPAIPLGTYGYYADLMRSDVKLWWSGNYYELIDSGLDMIWQDMTCPAVVTSIEAKVNYKTLPGDLLMSDLDGSLVPNAKIHNAYALNMIQATYEGLTRIKDHLPDDHYNKNKRNFIIARGGYTGLQRYAGNWTGDSASSWEFLSINIPQALNWGLSGQPLSGCDIGGFANGDIPSGQLVNAFSKNPEAPPYLSGGQPDPNLLTRWMTMGAFLPWYRNHYNGYTKAYQEPYNYSQYKYINTTYNENVLPACKKYIQIRYKLLQLFYDAMYECTRTGMPMCRAMFLNDPEDPTFFPKTDVDAVLLTPYNQGEEVSYDSDSNYRLADQFFVGRDLLVAPVVLQRWESGSFGSGQSIHPYPSRPVYVPKGSNWFDFNGMDGLSLPALAAGPSLLQGALNTVTRGGQLLTWNTSQWDLVPAYIRAGAIIPVRELEQYVGEQKTNILTFNIYPGPDSSYLCYQDDHTTMDHERKQAYRETQISNRHRIDIGGQEIVVSRLYDQFTPAEPWYYIALLGQTQAAHSVRADQVEFAANADLESLVASASNCWCYVPHLQVVLIKVLDQQPSLTLLVSGLQPIAS